MAVGTGPENRPRSRVLMVAGTHGNERNGPWLLEHWGQRPHALACAGLELELVLGNPVAHGRNSRYIDRDLNRSFEPSLLANPSCQELEVQRARQLIDSHGPGGLSPCSVALDLHSTTSSMGNCLVLYGRRPTDLALAAGIQAELGLPIYLHEADGAQTGFLVERWPCGLVIEVGPVPQGVLQALICRQTQLAVEACLAVLARAQAGSLRLPPSLEVHLHLGSLDIPRDGAGQPEACLHPRRLQRNWQPMAPGDELFCTASGDALPYSPPPGLAEQTVWPVFINEAAYGEKGIALSLTRREIWAVPPAWPAALEHLAEGLACGT
ncbi:aspartoacylase [Cyanobium sp. WAJ14-Wanaka]|uniref:aspartoacylase n=1 Tax=Cyanobium sp. WAJ14-Wanaka TaxID=2823725 RepID=UPI0020CDFE37|nr:aspartoacylase [Cyanobium sp. WAJ14-Wanaka]MCP9776092.1 aspartoacylase [Cyanobium sp. WAJ14-Wanaka]